jgi:hypothetical protein
MLIVQIVFKGVFQGMQPWAATPFSKDATLSDCRISGFKGPLT